MGYKMIINHGVRGSVPNSSPHTLKYGGNTPCVELKTKKFQLIFDCGSGFSKVDFSNNLETIIFISHFHHDHIQGLPFNNFEKVKNKKILITSAHSNKDIVYANLSKYYSSPYFPVDFLEISNIFEFVDFNDVISRFGDLKINSIDLNHPGNCSGYSVTIKDKKFCYLLDNEYDENQKKDLIKFCNYSDTIIWDGMFLESELKDKKGWGHSSIEQGMIFAKEIDVKNFIISHHSPSRYDEEIDKLQNSFVGTNIKFASENEISEF